MEIAITLALSWDLIKGERLKERLDRKKKKKKRDWRDMIWLAGRYCQLIKIHFIYLKSHLCQIFSFHAAPNHCIRSDYKSWIDITSLIWEKFQLVHLFWSIFFFLRKTHLVIFQNISAWMGESKNKFTESKKNIFQYIILDWRYLYRFHTLIFY